MLFNASQLFFICLIFHISSELFILGINIDNRSGNLQRQQFLDSKILGAIKKRCLNGN